MKHTNKVVYIEAIDDNGTRHNLTYKGWAVFTGHASNTISKRKAMQAKQKTEGLRPYTNREVVGIDEIEKHVRRFYEGKKENQSLVSKFLSRALVPQN